MRRPRRLLSAHEPGDQPRSARGAARCRPRQERPACQLPRCGACAFRTGSHRAIAAPGYLVDDTAEFLRLRLAAGVYALRVSDDSDTVGHYRRPRQPHHDDAGVPAVAQLRCRLGRYVYGIRHSGGAVRQQFASGLSAAVDHCFVQRRVRTAVPVDVRLLPS